MKRITLQDIQANPDCIAARLSNRSGLSVIFRPLMSSDAILLGRYFLNLSEETRRRYGPHPFDQATADHFCATIDYAHTIRMIATISSGAQEQAIAYFIFLLGVLKNDHERYASLPLPLAPRSDCTVAPSLADAYQNQGLGSPLMQHLFTVARWLGFKRMILMGGVQATNERGVHYYEKNGFRKVNTFEKPTGIFNYDMIRDL